MLVAIGVVVTLVVVLSGNEGGAIAEPIVSTTEGPTTPISTSPSSVAPPSPDPPPTDPGVTPTPDPEGTTVTEEPPAPNEGPLQLEEIINGNFAPISFNATWTTGNLSFIVVIYGFIGVYRCLIFKRLV